MSQRLLDRGLKGKCRACGVALVDWPRVHRCDLGDSRYTFEALRLELIRHHFWHVTLPQYAVNYARRKGRLRLRVAAERQILRLVGSAQHPREGYQTPRETSPKANMVHFAQHATASCCRRCISEWHGIPEGRALTQLELGYLTDLASRYIEERLPDLADHSVVVPSLRQTESAVEAT